MKPRTGTDEWNRKQKNCMKMAGAHLRPQFSVDDRVFMVLKYTETGNFLKTIRFERQFPNLRTPCRQTIMDNYNKYVQYGISLNKNVGKSGRPRTSRTRGNVDMVRRALEAHPLMTARHNTLPHLYKSSFNRITKTWHTIRIGWKGDIS